MIDDEDLPTFLRRTKGKRLTGAQLLQLNDLLTRDFGTDYTAWNPPAGSGPQ
jgi:hypothetical protein